jgi:hypothetical protein
MNAIRIARISSISACLILSAATLFPAFASSSLRENNPSSVTIKSSQIARESESEEDVLLPNVKSCAELQNLFNTTMRSEKVKFEGFEDRPLQIGDGPRTGLLSGKINYILTCANGYFTETSPKGKKTCDAYITVMRTMRSTEDRTSSTTELSKSSMKYGTPYSYGRNDSCIWR